MKFGSRPTLNRIRIFQHTAVRYLEENGDKWYGEHTLTILGESSECRVPINPILIEHGISALIFVE